MSTFAKATFDVGGYLACRPTYPSRLYEIIYTHHARNGGRFDRALDIGCGPGFVALSLATRFKSVVAIDPAKKMVEKGLQPIEHGAAKIDYRVGSVEQLTDIGIGTGEDGVDLVVAGQSAHWFDYPKAWAQLSKVVRPGGTVAFIGYAEQVFPDQPELNAQITHYSSSQDSLGSYWQPGRKIVEGLLDLAPFPVTPKPPSQTPLPNLDPAQSSPQPSIIDEQRSIETISSEVDWSVWDAESALRLKSHPDGKPWLMTKKFTYETLEGYYRTWSALHAYHEDNPEDKAKRGSEEGDIVDRFMRKLKRELRLDSNGEILAGWPLVLMMIKKKPQ